ncbi:class I lanthipeptide [Chitinophaga agrisoli]|uniref:class I lanthipeptide n=1 Tax=Chitinophaga agrisoli TaxID=2607653 RepID=UPI001661AB3F|nr:class I lanthipeptide [Chitinophaga agrisoli]
MKKATNPKKLQLSKIKIANLSKSKQAALKGGGICLTSYDETSCPTCSRKETLCNAI